jgi:hypothetical protein
MNQVWSKLGRVIGGLLAVGGLGIAIAIGVGIFLSHAAGVLLTLLLILLILFGITPIALGAWLLHLSLQAEQQRIRDRFYQVLHYSRGRFSLVEFAAATRLEPAIARRYLDSWAKACYASFEVTESGEVIYVFTTVPPQLPEPKLRRWNWHQWTAQWRQSA